MKEEKLRKAQPKTPAPEAAAPPAFAPKGIITLAVDIGGTGIKAAALDEKGKMVSERQKIKTPHNATPKKVIAIIAELAEMAGPGDRASTGFPGVVKYGVVYTAPNLGKGWKNYRSRRRSRKSCRCRCGSPTMRTCRASDACPVRATKW